MKTNPTTPFVKRNTVLWLTAMVLPAVLSLTLASTKFPWQIILPLLLLGPMLASNRMVAQASGGSADTAGPG
jgi:hypothetical protein